jgi:pyruvate dehydrogenase E2 component (dihydrolipoamide acetyltransferase)
MADIVRMPSVMAEATHAVLSEWLVEPGAHIAVGDVLAEIETDKAIVEYAAEIEGTIARLLVQPGAKVAVGDPIAVVLEAGEDASAASVDEQTSRAAVEPSVPASAPAPTPAPPSIPGALGATEAASHEAPGSPTSSGRLVASPIARRIAAERSIDLTRVTGTGPNGRIVRRDVEAHMAHIAARSSVVGLMAPTAGFTDVPLTGMRRAIARRLTESKTTVPHFYLTAHVRADRLLALRQEVNGVSSRKLSLNDFIVKAVATALAHVPAANAAWNGDSIRHFESVDVGVAVAVPNGLMTPVVRGAQRLGLIELSTQLGDLTERARSGRLQQQELEGGSFAVSNLGMYGVDEFSAILNPPQAGILAVAAAKRQPVVGESGELSVGTVMTVTLSADHRVIDGAVAAEWVAALVSLLENPVSLLV